MEKVVVKAGGKVVGKAVVEMEAEFGVGFEMGVDVGVGMEVEMEYEAETEVELKAELGAEMKVETEAETEVEVEMEAEEEVEMETETEVEMEAEEEVGALERVPRVGLVSQAQLFQVWGADPSAGASGGGQRAAALEAGQTAGAWGAVHQVWGADQKAGAWGAGPRDEAALGERSSGGVQLQTGTSVGRRPLEAGWACQLMDGGWCLSSSAPLLGRQTHRGPYFERFPLETCSATDHCCFIINVCFD